MEHVYWIKYMNNKQPEKYVFKTFEEMWHYIKEFMLRNNTGHVEWMIRD